jgi:hypothetical protein
VRDADQRRRAADELDNKHGVTCALHMRCHFINNTLDTCKARYTTIAPGGRQRQSLQATVTAACSTLLAPLQHQPHTRKSPEVLQVRQRVNGAAAAAAVAQNLAQGFRRGIRMRQAKWREATVRLARMRQHLARYGHGLAAADRRGAMRILGRRSLYSHVNIKKKRSSHATKIVRQTLLYAPHLHSHVKRVQTVPGILPASDTIRKKLEQKPGVMPTRCLPALRKLFHAGRRLHQRSRRSRDILHHSPLHHSSN